MSSVSSGMEDPLLSWVVLNLTDSSLIFGAVMSLRFAPNLIGPMTGVLADRFDRRQLLIILRVVRIASGIFLGALLIGGQLQMWHVIVIILLGSFINIFQMPAQTAYVADIVGREDLTNALAINRVSMDVNMFGSFLVGILVNVIGVGQFYYLNAAIYFASLIPLLMIRGVPKTQVTREKSVTKNLVDGFKYSWKNRPVFGGQLIYFTTNLFFWPFKRTVLFAFAKSVLNADASGLGWISTGSSIGDFFVTIAIAQMGNVRRKGWIVLLSCMATGLIMMLVAVSTTFTPVLIYLIILGAVSAFTGTYANVLMLINTEPEMRGRVMGINQFGIGSQFPGTVVAGSISAMWGDAATVGLEGGLLAVTTLAIIGLVPSLRRAD